LEFAARKIPFDLTHERQYISADREKPKKCRNGMFISSSQQSVWHIIRQQHAIIISQLRQLLNWLQLIM
jgi:hypothetical protein